MDFGNRRFCYYHGTCRMMCATASGSIAAPLSLISLSSSGTSLKLLKMWTSNCFSDFVGSASQIFIFASLSDVSLLPQGTFPTGFRSVRFSSFEWLLVCNNNPPVLTPSFNTYPPDSLSGVLPGSKSTNIGIRMQRHDGNQD
jgi:hypothetical protein